MALSDFIQRRDGDLDEQEGNFITKFPNHIAALGIEPAEETAVSAILTAHRTAYSTMIGKKAEAKASVAANLDAKKAAIDEFRRIAKKIKSSTGYTEEIGRDLGIIGPEAVPPDLMSVKPVLKASVSGSTIVVEFDKGSLEGIRLYCKRGAETEFTYLATDTHSPYTDNRPKLEEGKPENRQYYAYYLSDDYEVGQQSDILTIAMP